MGNNTELSFTFNFQNSKDKTKHPITVVEYDKQSAYQKARQKAISKNLAKDKQDFESTFQIKETSVRYADPPWDSSQELKNDLKQIQGVSRVRYSDPYTGTYGPPTYYLTVNRNSSKRTVKQNVKSYFSGLVIGEDGGSVTVQIKPQG